MVDNGVLASHMEDLNRLAWFKSLRPPGVVLHSSREPGELSQWICHDDSTINIAIGIIIIIITDDDGSGLLAKGS